MTYGHIIIYSCKLYITDENDCVCYNMSLAAWAAMFYGNTDHILKLIIVVTFGHIKSKDYIKQQNKWPTFLISKDIKL